MIYIYIIISIFFILLTKLYLEIKSNEERFRGDVVKMSNKILPQSANEYYKKSSKKKKLPSDKLYLQKFNIMDSRKYNSLDKTLGPIMPLNSEDYPDFKNNFDVYGSVGKALNPDLPKKKIVPHFTSLEI